MLAPPTGRCRRRRAGRDRRSKRGDPGRGREPDRLGAESFITGSDNRDPAIAAVTPAGALDTAAFAGGTRLRPATPREGSLTRPTGSPGNPDGKLVIGGTARRCTGRSTSWPRASPPAAFFDTGFASPAGSRPRISAERPPPAARWRSRTQGSPMSAEMRALTATSGLRRSMHTPLRPRGGGGGGGGAQPAAPSVPAAKKKCKKRSTGAAAAKKCKKRK